MKKFAVALWICLAVLSLRADSGLDALAKLAALKQVKADSWKITGDNYIISGKVQIVHDNTELSAERIIINPKTKDLEAVGTIRLVYWKKSVQSISLEQLEQLEKQHKSKIFIKSIQGDVYGNKTFSVELLTPVATLKADRLIGNLTSGYFRFDNLAITAGNFAGRARSGERFANGLIQLKDGEISSCPYLESDNAHYSIGAQKIELRPYRNEFYGADSISRNLGEYAISIYGGIVRLYGLPVFYLPYFYKPKDESPGLFSIRAGRDSSWGYYVNMSRKFDLTDYPASYVRLLLDLYERRGVGIGAKGGIESEQSRTEFFAYSIYDRNPFYKDDYDLYRIDIPHWRYDFRITNVTHITPRLDFRGSFEYVSDPYIRRDFFYDLHIANPEPATYAALEQQFDFLSASIYFQPQVVKSFTTVESLPEFQLNAHRQQIFNTPLYYQGDFSTGYYRMRWLHFNEPLQQRLPNSDLQDYQAWRLDTTHFLYLPWNTRYFSLVPRAGIRMTAYSRSSDEAVEEVDWLKMEAAASPKNLRAYSLKKYDSRGGSQFRVAGELGVELSTKIHNTWNNIRSAAMQLDGLRHVMRPYANYTYINNPSVNRKYLYYFDDVDRLDRQHFLRVGLENRLETRSGNSIREFLRMENYLDIFMRREDDFNNLGCFCTKLSVTPLKGLTLGTALLIDTGNNNDELPSVWRNGREVGHPGLNVSWINRWNINLSYSPIEDLKFYLNYDYIRPYTMRSSYSMGSTLTQFDAASSIDKYYTDYTQTISGGVAFPITPDRRTFGAAEMIYDFQTGHVSDYRFMLRRIFHCVEVTAQLNFSYDDDVDKKEWDTSFSVQARLTGLDMPTMAGTNSVLSSSQSSNMFGAD